MKSLPEKDFWKVIKNRLENYREEPQDDWLKIAAAIPASPSHNRSMNVAADLLSVAGLVFLLQALFAVTPVTHTGAPDPLRAQPAVSERSTVPQTDTLKAGNKMIAALERYTTQQLHDSPRQGHVAQGDPKKKNKSPRGTPRKIIRDRQRHEQQLPGAAQTPGSGAIRGEQVTPTFAHISDAGRAGEAQPGPDSVQIDKTVEADTVYFSVPPILPQKSKPKRRFRPSVYAMITPSFAYQKIIPLRNDGINIQKLNGAGIVSADRLGFSMEAGFQMQVSSYFELYAALSYYQQQQSVSYSYASANGIQVAGATNTWSYQLSPDETTRTFNYAMRNAGAAAGVLYHLRGRKLMHKIGAGLQYQKGLISSRGESTYNNASSAYFNYQLMYRMEYSLSGRASFFFQPQFVHSLMADEALREPFDIKPYRAGLGFGLVYHLY